ncbi:MAG TPA: hypothetical protein PLY72_13475, partial [Candidatus Obscuribacter sp.]|nr:hypothetical protein [Candidatus Obscuribacter sp.]
APLSKPSARSKAPMNLLGTLPAVISAQKGLNEPRYPGIKGVMAARRKEIAVKDAAALGVKGQVGGDKLQVTIKEMALPPERPQGRKIEGDTDSAVSELVNLLRSEAHVL